MVVKTIPQPMPGEHRRNAAPIKAPSTKLWKASPTAMAAMRRYLPGFTISATASGSLFTFFTSSGPSALLPGAVVLLNSGPWMCSCSSPLNTEVTRVSTTRRKKMPPRMEAPHTAADMDSSLTSSPMRCAASGSMRNTAADRSAPAAKLRATARTEGVNFERTLGMRRRRTARRVMMCTTAAPPNATSTAISSPWSSWSPCSSSWSS
mmetsp:Transcript_22677/g.61412  ORF Transcript_22677/g.61412 Transcript_22677/m.61412 type:complete len:207 (+) Transcript_22677:567-1187(+)